ncbi:hypothetical protein [Kitasatospora aureofaciens]|uniref:hypothetical protein n=1 Tax=Kitasatospora aureofaciens TaxID=1894 RepID=UPI002109E055|nr:hypothetical protein [Kitasatospora aureofaciens]
MACWSSVTRVLLTRDQVLAYGLPPTAGKKDDPRRHTGAVRRRCGPEAIASSITRARRGSSRSYQVSAVPLVALVLEAGRKRTRPGTKPLIPEQKKEKAKLDHWRLLRCI